VRVARFTRRAQAACEPALRLCSRFNAEREQAVAKVEIKVPDIGSYKDVPVIE
jgi:hypothetical protein